MMLCAEVKSVIDRCAGRDREREVVARRGRCRSGLAACPLRTGAAWPLVGTGTHSTEVASIAAAPSGPVRLSGPPMVARVIGSSRWTLPLTWSSAYALPEAETTCIPAAPR